jgi:ATP-dependent DNA ligase
VNLPVNPPVKPMLARPVRDLPPGMLYEPKWDGFRCIVFRDRDEVELASRNERPMSRYFPEVVRAASERLPQRCVLDGEIVVVRGKGLDFEALQQRIHPAASRVDLLARRTPASFIAFDLLALGDSAYVDHPFSERRALLEQTVGAAGEPFHVTPATDDVARAREWFEAFEGAGLDGIIAKPPGLGYRQDQRVMFKVKHERTADCVVAGFRWHRAAPVIGSLLLGLYDDGVLHHVGVCGAFSAKRRRDLVAELSAYRTRPGELHPWSGAPGTERVPGGQPSRWNVKKDMSWEPLRPELVVEVAYDYMEGPRFRHTAQFRRWRPDRDPRSCTYDQLERPVDFDLRRVLQTGGAELGAGSR